MAEGDRTGRHRAVGWRRWAASALGASSVLVACGAPSGTGPAPKPAAAVGSVEELMPMKPNTVWSFETVGDDPGSEGMAAMEVVSRSGDRVRLAIAGRSFGYTVRADAIAADQGGYLLRAPLEVGREFPGTVGTVRILKTDAAIEVPAGSFRGCVVTREVVGPVVASGGARTAASGSLTTVFCPGTGIVQRVVQAGGEAGSTVTEYRLKSYGERIDFEAL